MPELPDLVVYIESIQKRVLRERLEGIRLNSPFVLRTAVPPIDSIAGKELIGINRIGKRIVFEFEDNLSLVLHLMIAGRLHYREPNAKLAGKNSLAALDFPSGALVLTEAGTKRRASLHLIEGTENLNSLDPGGIDVLECDYTEFTRVLTSENHTLKRALTDPRLFSGIGNAYSDEILFDAMLSPVTLTTKLTPEERLRLFNSVQSILEVWTSRLRNESKDKFPENVTAFHKEMAVHGRYKLPCVRCGAPIQRIRYADNETNYCVNCQTNGKLLSDRALSRLLGNDWPKTLDALEMLSRNRQG